MDIKDFFDSGNYFSFKEASFFINNETSLEKKKELMKSIARYNCSLCRKKNGYLNRLKNSALENNEVADINLSVNGKGEKVIYSHNDFLASNVNVSNFFNTINSFESDNDFDVLYSLIDHSNFEICINSIIAHYVLEDVALRKMVYEAGEDFFIDEKIKIKFIIDNLIRIRDCFVKSEDVSYNNLIFTKTESSNVLFLSDLNKIPVDYYDYISNCIYSILDGSFKNMKRIGKVDEGFYCALYQVRDSDIRVYYSNLNSSTYIIGGVLLKKVSTSRDYSTYVRKISRDIKNCKDLIGDNINKKIITDNQAITDEVVNILKLKKRGI